MDRHIIFINYPQNELIQNPIKQSFLSSIIKPSYFITNNQFGVLCQAVGIAYNYIWLKNIRKWALYLSTKVGTEGNMILFVSFKCYFARWYHRQTPQSFLSIVAVLCKKLLAQISNKGTLSVVLPSMEENAPLPNRCNYFYDSRMRLVCRLPQRFPMEAGSNVKRCLIAATVHVERALYSNYLQIAAY